MSDNKDVLGITEYKGHLEDGRQVFGIRGWGETYKFFYKWLRQEKRTEYEHDDFPWHYITLNEESEKEMRERFYIDIVEADDD